MADTVLPESLPVPEQAALKFLSSRKTGVIPKSSAISFYPGKFPFAVFSDLHTFHKHAGRFSRHSLQDSQYLLHATKKDKAPSASRPKALLLHLH